jgi:hypothetical protein
MHHRVRACGYGHAKLLSAADLHQITIVPPVWVRNSAKIFWQGMVSTSGFAWVGGLGG